MISLKKFVFNDFQENSFVLHDETKECIVVDPGCNGSAEEQLLLDYIKQENLKPVKVVNTHCHIDHILGVNFVKEEYNISFYAHQAEEILVNRAVEQASLFGFSFKNPPVVDGHIGDGECISFGNSNILAFHCPGHSPGSLCLYCADEKIIIAGDVLFSGSIGRTDLPGGNYDTLINSIKNKLMILPKETVVYPGHGPETTIGQENDINPFLA